MNITTGNPNSNDPTLSNRMQVVMALAIDEAAKRLATQMGVTEARVHALTDEMIVKAEVLETIVSVIGDYLPDELLDLDGRRWEPSSQLNDEIADYLTALIAIEPSSFRFCLSENFDPRCTEIAEAEVPIPESIWVLAHNIQRWHSQAIWPVIAKAYENNDTWSLVDALDPTFTTADTIIIPM